MLLRTGVMPGQLFNEDIDAQTYAEWGLDYLKSDNCASYALDSSVRFGAMRSALNRTGRAIVLSIEPFSINPDPEQSYKVSNLWRTGCDISGDWATVTNRADIADKWASLAGPGGWNDPDMINVQNPPGSPKSTASLGCDARSSRMLTFCNCWPYLCVTPLQLQFTLHPFWRCPSTRLGSWGGGGVCVCARVRVCALRWH